MKPEDFIRIIRERIIQEDLQSYSELLLTPISNVTDPDWKAIIPLYKELSDDQKKAFLKFVRLIEVNTVAHFLGILDGSSYFNESGDTFVLKIEGTEQQINGDLLDTLWQIEEDEQ